MLYNIRLTARSAAKSRPILHHGKLHKSTSDRSRWFCYLQICADGALHAARLIMLLTNLHRRRSNCCCWKCYLVWNTAAEWWCNVKFSAHGPTQCNSQSQFFSWFPVAVLGVVPAISPTQSRAALGAVPSGVPYTVPGIMPGTVPA